MSSTITLVVVADQTKATIIRGDVAIDTFRVSGVSVGAIFHMKKGEFKQGEYAIVHKEARRICLIKVKNKIGYVFDTRDVSELEALFQEGENDSL